MNRQTYALGNQLRARENQIGKLRRKMAAMKHTWSWRLTRPLRRLARSLGR